MGQTDEAGIRVHVRSISGGGGVLFNIRRALRRNTESSRTKTPSIPRSILDGVSIPTGPSARAPVSGDSATSWRRRPPCGPRWFGLFGRYGNVDFARERIPAAGAPFVEATDDVPATKELPLAVDLYARCRVRIYRRMKPNVVEVTLGALFLFALNLFLRAIAAFRMATEIAHIWKGP